MQKPLPISVCMISGAEARRIGRALASVSGWTAETVVVLNQEVADSTDVIACTAGAKVFRGGAFKPRSSPYSFQGLGEEGLKLMRDACNAENLKLVTEVMDVSQIELIGRYAAYDYVNLETGEIMAEAGEELNENSLGVLVDAGIEEIDILDLQTRLAGDLPDDVRRVYENLLAGSNNHLSAFTSTLTRQTGEVYAPQFLSADAYRQALALASIGGNGNGSGNGYRGGQP